MRRFSKYFLTSIYIVFVLSGLNNYLNSQELQIFIKDEPTTEYKKFQTHLNLDSLALNEKLNSIMLTDISTGYISAGYDSVIYDSILIKAYYVRGDKYSWGSLDLSKFYKTLKIKRKSRKTDNVNPIELSILFNKILDYYANSGYPFAQIRLDSIKISDTIIDAKLNFELGDIYYFDSIIIKGEPRIKHHYLLKQIGIRKNDVFSLKRVNNLNQQLKTISFIEQSRPYQVAFSDEHADILLYLKSKKASSFSGLIGIMPNNQTTGKLLITGDINLYLINSAGLGEDFGFKWQKFETLSQTLNTHFSVPYLFASDFGAGGEMNLEKRDSSYLNTDFIIKLIYGSNISNGFELFYRKIGSFLLIDSASGDNQGYSDYSTNLFGITYRKIDTDNPVNPRKGYRLKLSGSLGTKILDATIGEEELKPILHSYNYADISFFLPLFNHFTLKFRNLTASTYSKIISENETSRLGGLNTLRGFDELSMPVTSFSLLNNELRYIFDEESALFGFFDIAYFEKRYTIEDSYNYAMGIGMGLDINTNAGIFSIVFAAGKQNDNPFQFNNSKVHFGYRSRF